MDRTQTARCHLLVATNYGVKVTREQVEVWHLLLGDLDGDAVEKATVELCKRSKFKITPAEIREAVEEMAGTAAPSTDAAVGYFLTGEWERHPAVAAAAKRVHWDRRREPERATNQFRTLYASAVDSERRARYGALWQAPVRSLPARSNGTS